MQQLTTDPTPEWLPRFLPAAGTGSLGDAMRAEERRNRLFGDRLTTLNPTVRPPSLGNVFPNEGDTVQSVTYV